MLHCSWDRACDRCSCYFSFWAIFCPFTSLTAQKIKISKKWKNISEMSSIYTSLPKIMIICYTVREIWRVTDVTIIFHLGLFFVLSPPSQSKKWKFKKNEKKAWRDGCNCYFSFWAIFYPFTPPNNPKNKNFKKLKKNLWK